MDLFEQCSLYHPIDSKLVKNLSHLKFDEKINTVFTHRLKFDDKYDKIFFVDVLRLLMPLEEFIELIDNKFVSIKTKLDLKDLKMQETYHKQCHCKRTAQS